MPFVVFDPTRVYYFASCSLQRVKDLPQNDTQVFNDQLDVVATDLCRGKPNDSDEVYIATVLRHLYVRPPRFMNNNCASSAVFTMTWKTIPSNRESGGISMCGHFSSTSASSRARIYTLLAARLWLLHHV